MAYDHQEKSRAGQRRAGVGRSTGTVTAPQEGVGSIGNRVGEVAPEGNYMEHVSEPINSFGERARPRKPKGSKGNPYGENQYAVPDQLGTYFPEDRRLMEPPERGPFGVLAEGQSPDSNLIVGENKLGHHIGMDKEPGAGQLDEAAKRDLGMGVYGIPPHIPESVMRRNRFNHILAGYAAQIEHIHNALLELYETDPTYFDTHYLHMRKTHLPGPIPDPTLQHGFASFEAVLHQRRGVSPKDAKGIVPQHFHPDHPDYVPPSDEQKLLPYQQGGYAGMTHEMARSYRVSWRDVERANAARKPPEPVHVSSLPHAALDIAAGRAPQPWKDPQ